MAPFKIGFLIYPAVTQLDFTGPAQAFALMAGSELFFVSSNLEPVETDAGFAVLPTTTFDDCPALDMICVPGGGGQLAVMSDRRAIAWLQRQAEAASYITSVCSGSLILGAAGLLKGYRSGSHWSTREYLKGFGAIPSDDRVMKDRNRITAGGVTAGIDFALSIIADLRGEAEARAIQLALEYDPHPPFDSGTPGTAGADTIAAAKSLLEGLRRAAPALIDKATLPCLTVRALG